MKQINYIFVFLFALFFGTNVAQADSFSPYSVDFNTAISTTAHDFKVASGWGHIVQSYDDDSGWNTETYSVDYAYGADTGRDGSGALKIGSQTIGSGWYSNTVNDLLVTPQITGASSIYVKQVNSYGTIKFYKVTKTGAKYTRGDEITLETTPTLSTSDWVKVDIPAQTEPTYIGIRGNNVYIDDFSADKAEYELVKALKIDKVTNNGKQEPDCNAEGKFPINYTVQYTNNGDIDLTPGMEGYSLSIVNYSKENAVVYTLPLTEPLAVGASATATLATDVDYATYPSRNRYDVMENLTQTTSYGTWIEPTKYAPEMQIRNSDGRIDAGESFAYGMVNEPTSKDFTIRNNGAAPLIVTAVDVPEGFSHNLTLPLTVAPHQDAALSITVSNAVAGIFSGNVTIKGNDVDDFTFAVSATVLDPSKYFESFSSEDVPAGMILEGSWEIKQRDYSSSENPYLASNGSRGQETMLITPLLKVTEGEKMTVDAARTNYYQSGSDVYLKVYYSSDRQNWTLTKTIASEDMSSSRAVSSTYYYGELKTFVIDNIPAGNYYIGFGAGYTCVDNIYGFEKVNVAHDVMVAEKKFPSVGVVNNKYEATLKIKNLNTAAEAAGSYTLTLYADNEPVATAESSEIAATGQADFTLAYTPHAAGTVKVYAEYKNAADNYIVKTPEVDVTIAEEQAVSDVVIGKQNGTQSNEVFYLNYADNSKGGLCDFIYNAEMLTKFGLKAGDKVAGVSFTGSPNTSKTVKQLHQTLAYGMVAEAEYKAGENTDALTTVTIVDGDDVTFTEGTDYVTNVTFPTPIVWDGTSAIRFYTYVKSDAGNYINVSYPVDTDYNTANYKSGTAKDWSSKTTPLATFAIQKDPATISGTVKCGDAAVADASVTLKSADDVIYSGKTDAKGAYSFSVIQTEKTYTLTATAEGYVDYTEENVSVASNLEKNITLKKKAVSVTGKIMFHDAPVADVAVTLSSGELNYTATTTDEGVYTFAEVEPGKEYILKAAKEKFNDYTSEPVEITENESFADIVMTKPNFKVTGQLKWGNTPVKGIVAQLTWVSADGDDMKYGTFTNDDGKFEFSNLNAAYVYTFNIVDINNEFENQPAVATIENGEDAEENFSLTIKPVVVKVAADGYMTYNYKRALDFSTTPALKAYAVSAVNGNYTELTELSEVPANTGILIDGAAGEYEVMPIETAAAVESNLLVATTADYTISAENVGKAWALTTDNGKNVFKSVAGTTVAKGGAYLDCESSASIIYLNQTDGIHAVDSTSSNNGMLDPTKPMYNLAGQQVDSSYRGVVIQNGKKIKK